MRRFKKGFSTKSSAHRITQIRTAEKNEGRPLRKGRKSKDATGAFHSILGAVWGRRNTPYLKKKEQQHWGSWFGCERWWSRATNKSTSGQVCPPTGDPKEGLSLSQSAESPPPIGEKTKRKAQKRNARRAKENQIARIPGCSSQ